MTSLADIPMELFEPIARAAFKQWIKSLPVPASEKRTLIKAYRESLGQTWKQKDYDDAGIPSNG